MPHIKMPEVAPLVRYVAGGEAVFGFPFPIFADEDLAVFLDGARITSGYSVTGAGQTAGGSVTFDTAPQGGAVVVLQRILPYERLTDFLPGGVLAADSLNSELDYLMACIQQLDRGQDSMLRYPDSETQALNLLPDKTIRAGKALGFDESGNPQALRLGATAGSSTTSFTASGTGAVVRDLNAKLSDFISVRDFGAAGDGVADDTTAIINALAAHDAVYVPPGTYRLTATIDVGEGKTLQGAGERSILRMAGTALDVAAMPAGHAVLRDLRLENGLTGVRLFGRDGACVQNRVQDLHIADAQHGIVLDGHNDTNKPCYWNYLDRIKIARPSVDGVKLERSGNGDTPNANRFTGVRVQSMGTAMTGAGFNVDAGSHSNSFTDCEADLDAGASACFRAGEESFKTFVINFYAESDGAVPNILLAAGSQQTAIVNLHAFSAGAAIDDSSDGSYDLVGGGGGQDRLQKLKVPDLTQTLRRYDTEYFSPFAPGIYDVELSGTIKFVSAAAGDITMRLPAAGDADSIAAVLTFKKIDNTANEVAITESGGDGPDRKTFRLGGRYDYVTVMSNGTEWFVLSSNRMPGNTTFIQGQSLIEPNLSRDMYLVSAFGGPTEFRLPPANASYALGRRITVKKTDPSGNAVSVTEQGGNGPDQNTQSLSARYDALTVLSDGAEWYIVSRHR